MFEEKHESHSHTRNPSSASAYEILPQKNTSLNHHQLTKNLQDLNIELNGELLSGTVADPATIMPESLPEKDSLEKPTFS